MSRFTSAGPSQRQLRVGEQVRHAVSQVLSRGDINDDVLSKTVISITEVRMSPDLKIATCFISVIGNQDDQTVIKALANHAKFLRGRVGPYLRQMKYMPEFRFRVDTSFDNFAKIDALLRSPEVLRDLQESDDQEGENQDDQQNGNDA